MEPVRPRREKEVVDVTGTVDGDGTPTEEMRLTGPLVVTHPSPTPTPRSSQRHRKTGRSVKCSSQNPRTGPSHDSVHPYPWACPHYLPPYPTRTHTDGEETPRVRVPDVGVGHRGEGSLFRGSGSVDRYCLDGPLRQVDRTHRRRGRPHEQMV